jgi:hypothetical protein
MHVAVYGGADVYRRYLSAMRNGTKLRHLLSVCDMHLTMDDDGNIILTTISRAGLGKRRKDGATFSAVLDKAYRQMLKDLKEGGIGEEE